MAKGARAPIAVTAKALRPVSAEGQDNGRGSRDIAFGELFSIYVVVSNKLVGVLLRARKHGIVDFEGETLFQGRDDKTVVTLNKDPAEVRRLQRRQEEVDGGGEGGEFQWGKCLKTE